MSYTFVYENKNWWLKITTIEQLLEYWKVFDKKLKDAQNNLPNTKEFGNGWDHANVYETAVGMGDCEDIIYSVHKGQYQCLCENGSVFINKNGAYNINDVKYSQFIHKNDLEFPKSLIGGEVEIKRFPLGNHYYVYINGVQIREGDKLKWNTPEEAQKIANKYIKTSI